MNEPLLEQILAPANLQAAWKQVKRNKGAAGIDHLGIADYPKWAKQHWPGIRQALTAGYYVPQPVKRVEIPKPNGGKRLLGIPTVNDRVIQQAITQALMPIFDRHFSSHSYGFRPHKSAHQAVLSVRSFIQQGSRYAVDIDLSKFFDNVDHDLLMYRISRRIRDKRVLKLIGRYLRAGVDLDGMIQPTRLGVPQGGPLSPLLANIMLDDLDKYLESKHYAFARYADDFVICVENQAAGERIKEDVECFLETLKLPINEAKSGVVKTNQLSFLGFTFRGKKIVWSDKALKGFKHQLRLLTNRTWSVSWTVRYEKLRRYIVGWINYFGLSEYYRPVPGLDEWLRRRIRMGYLKQWRRPRTRIRNLIKLGVGKRQAISLGLSSKGYYRLAKTYAVQLGLNDQWLKDQGLVSIREQWIKFHYN